MRMLLAMLILAGSVYADEKPQKKKGQRERSSGFTEKELDDIFDESPKKGIGATDEDVNYILYGKKKSGATEGDVKHILEGEKKAVEQPKKAIKGETKQERRQRRRARKATKESVELPPPPIAFENPAAGTGEYTSEESLDLDVPREKNRLRELEQEVELLKRSFKVLSAEVFRLQGVMGERPVYSPNELKKAKEKGADGQLKGVE